MSMSDILAALLFLLVPLRNSKADRIIIIIIIIIITIIVVVFVVHDDTNYWVYLSSDHLFQVYYKVRQVLLQSATPFFITKCDGLLLQSATAFLLQSVTSVITKCDRYYKV